MLIETSYYLLSVNIKYRSKQSISVKITGCFVSGRQPQAACAENELSKSSMFHLAFNELA